MPIFPIAQDKNPQRSPLRLRFFLHSQKNILREWYSYLETVILAFIFSPRSIMTIYLDFTLKMFFQNPFSHFVTDFSIFRFFCKIHIFFRVLFLII